MSISKKKTRVIKLVESQEVTWEEALKEYLLWKKAEGRAERTLKDYGFHVKLFFTRFPGTSLTDVKALEKNIIEYMGEDVKPAYYNNKMVYLKTFFGWCVKKEYLKSNPLNDFKRRKADSRIVQFEPDYIKKLLSLPDHKTFPGLRDYSLILLQLDTGIRPKEALSLLVTDINLNSLEVYVRAENAKTRIARTLPISPYTAKAILRIMKVRPSDWDDSIPVFCTCEGTKLSGNGWYKRLSEYGQQLGTIAYPYQLRHTFALQYLRNGGNSFALQKTLGHTDLNMTKRYVSLADSDIKEQHLIASPVANLIQQNKRIRKLI